MTTTERVRARDAPADALRTRQVELDSLARDVQLLVTFEVDVDQGKVLLEMAVHCGFVSRHIVRRSAD